MWPTLLQESHTPAEPSATDSRLSIIEDTSAVAVEAAAAPPLELTRCGAFCAWRGGKSSLRRRAARLIAPNGTSPLASCARRFVPLARVVSWFGPPIPRFASSVARVSAAAPVRWRLAVVEGSAAPTEVSAECARPTMPARVTVTAAAAIRSEDAVSLASGGTATSHVGMLGSAGPRGTCSRAATASTSALGVFFVSLFASFMTLRAPSFLASLERGCSSAATDDRASSTS